MTSKIHKEKRFQISLGITMLLIGAILGFSTNHLLQIRSEHIKKNCLVKLLMASIANDLQYTIPAANGIKNQIKGKKFIQDPDLFKMLYCPSVTLPSSDDIGLLNIDILTKLDEYRRRLSECNKRRQEYIEQLKNNDLDNIEVALFAYCLILDSVIRTGNNVLVVINKHYPNFEVETFTIPQYVTMEESMDELKKAMNEATEERRKK
jgi:hypothetical protein